MIPGIVGIEVALAGIIVEVNRGIEEEAGVSGEISVEIGAEEVKAVADPEGVGEMTEIEEDEIVVGAMVGGNVGKIPFRLDLL